MSDFTREELIFIKETVNTDIKYYGSDHIGHRASEKLKSMIDNYHYCNFDMQGYCSTCKGWRGMDGCYERK